MKKKKFGSLTGAAMAVLAVGAILTGNYIIEEARDERTLSLSSWFRPPETLNMEGQPQTVFHPGETFIMHYSVERQPLTCWAIWIDIMEGPVGYQFGPSRTQIMVDKVTRVDLKSMRTLPDPLPAGQYHLSQMAYPTCDGREVKPFKNDTGVVITILPK